MFVRKILWWFRYHRYDDLRRTNPHPSKEQWVSWNTDNLGCPIGRAYNSREVKELLRDFKIEETHLFRQGWFRFILAKPKE
jgi:hypothetical protein